MPARPTRSNFVDLTKYMNGHIYDFRTGSQADQFITATKAIAIYAGRMCTNPQDIMITIEKLYDVTLSIHEKWKVLMMI